MTIPSELKYSKSHEWVKFLDSTTAQIGITDYAQSELGDLVFVNLPQVGDAIVAGEVLCDVESVKAVSDIYSPVTGEVATINEVLFDAPESINETPYEAWLVTIKNITGKVELLNAALYKILIEEGD